MARKSYLNNNAEIRARLEKAGIPMFIIASRLRVSPTTLSIWLRFPLTEEREKLINQAIDAEMEGKA